MCVCVFVLLGHRTQAGFLFGALARPSEVLTDGRNPDKAAALAHWQLTVGQCVLLLCVAARVTEGAGFMDKATMRTVVEEMYELDMRVCQRTS